MNNNIIFLCFALLFIKFLINTRAKQELLGVEPGTSDLLAFGCPTDPYAHLYIYIYIYIYIYYIYTAPHMCIHLRLNTLSNTHVLTLTATILDG